MDRWYYAEKQENIWLSFPSADRNKLDEETYLILKKEHGNDNQVTQNARYKIIAIEDGAPDFVKTDRRTLTTIILDNSNNEVMSGGPTANLNIQEPTGLTSGTQIEIPHTQIET